MITLKSTWIIDHKRNMARKLNQFQSFLWRWFEMVLIFMTCYVSHTNTGIELFDCCVVRLFSLPCTSLWIKASAKWLNVNENISHQSCTGSALDAYQEPPWVPPTPPWFMISSLLYKDVHMGAVWPRCALVVNLKTNTPLTGAVEMPVARRETKWDTEKQMPVDIISYG